MDSPSIALICAVILFLVYLKLTSFRAFLLWIAFFTGCLVDGLILYFFASQLDVAWRGDWIPIGVPFTLLPILAVIGTWLVYMARTESVRKALITLTVLIVCVGGFLLFYEAIAVICGTFLVLVFLWGFLSDGECGRDYFAASTIHSIVPSVSVGEAYFAKKTGLI